MKPLSSLLLSAALSAAAPPHPASPQAPLGNIPTLVGEETLTEFSQNSLDDVVNASPLLSFHRDLVSIESISGNEGAAGAFVVDFLESHNFTVIKQPVSTESDARFNIFAFPKSHSLDESRPSQGPQILLTSHLDTVPPFIPYSLHRDANDTDDRNILIAGRGTVDAKGSVAAQIFAVLDTLAAQPAAPLGLLFVVGEETGGDGMKAFSASPRLNPSPSPFHTVIFGEPTELALVAGHKGMLGFEVAAHGHAAHSGYPWLGESAISAILPALARVDQLGDIPADEGGLPASDKYGRTTVNIGRMEGGVATNVVPSEARAGVAVRLAAGTDDEAREIVLKAVRDATGGDDRVVVNFRLEGYGPQDLDTDVPGFNVTTVNYGTDVPNLQLHDRPDGKVKRYLYGPGSIHVAHGDNEALTVAQLEEAVRGYKKLIQAALDRSTS
ncbi:probable carboxypeptidase AFUA_6G06800 [Aspergillus udagawae]|uniref:Probable carboxypeptidase AFUA_6G06800 n=1 Tax=Aspergillus udagawae TaxID=91492 RepID=A0A8H3SH10_9EURO|nr:probable carboxypeptidase AFUA_6G06800 [Aspergillus udagawae]